MKFSETWLREWVNPTIDTQQLSHQLTMAGLEVDAIEAIASVDNRIVVGEVLAVEPHPDADRLTVCEIKLLDSTLTIVCGAKNVRVGHKVPVATIGAVLPAGLKIKKSKLRGVTSHGMLCSATELGIAEESEGIWILPADAPLSQPITDYLALNDTVIEVDLTPNRGDCLSIQGIARDVATLNKLPLTPPDFKTILAKHNDTLAVNLTAKEACPRYVGRVIKNINNQATSPSWLQERLRRSGIRSISPVVDVSNYVMLELGQPMHAFDLAKLDQHIEVRMAKTGEKLTLLDEQTITLNKNSLVIADKKGAVALAGIMGGSATAVTDTTQDLFLESAFFTPTAIAGVARSYGLHTESSRRFERGVDPQLPVIAIERMTELLLNIVGGEPGSVQDTSINTLLPKAVSITLHESHIAQLLGYKIATAEVVAILQGLGMQLDKNDKGWHVRVPSYRFDITIAEDLIEEIARIYGYDHIPPTLPRGDLVAKPINNDSHRLRHLQRCLVARGYSEAICYSFISPELQQLFAPDQHPVSLKNAIASDLSIMRASLLPGLIRAAKHNIARQQQRVRLFETGQCFIQQQDALQQTHRIAGVALGLAYPEQWNHEKKAIDFYDVKADVEALLKQAAITKDIEFTASKHPCLHPGKTAGIKHNGENIGYLGEISPVVAQKLEITHHTVLFELDLAPLLKKRLPSYQPLSKYPEIRRDLAIEVAKSTPVAHIINLIKHKGGEFLQKVLIFDIYQGDKITSGMKSVAIGLLLQHPTRTLVDEEIKMTLEHILSTLKKELGAKLRD